MQYFKLRRFAVLLAILSGTSTLLAADAELARHITVPTDWKGEQIMLPPSFARGMKFKGIEEARFSPGMFQEKSDTFFSYFFVFKIDPGSELTQKNIERELLTYYQGLSRTIFNSRKAKVDTSGFSCELKKVVPVDPQKIYPEGLTEYSATVKWIEPFVTQKPQTLHLIIQVWTDKTTKDGYLFACVSPQEMKAEIWQSMQNIRDTFYRSLQK
ncbi:MAG TPA: hypothetical protein DIT97_25225 [Gimesia maris]|jgi:hypothetical protein|uniref:Methanolan biosynthesis EpsI domain-containing protein n=1 Tax=Gimesia maris TaxID=122 RepID=A0A3D3RBE4_9PLAN|nr:hypothetical protein [Gimesia maris]|tara:strand:- start:3024 stop:3662 length:639 start_codon:yes stop_codon:yes gene_type:complete